MIHNPATIAITTLNIQLAQLQQQKTECHLKVEQALSDLWKVTAKNKTKPYEHDAQGDFFSACCYVREFCALARKTQSVFLRKFSAHRIDRSVYQEGYDNILRDLQTKLKEIISSKIDMIENLDEEVIKKRDMNYWTKLCHELNFCGTDMQNTVLKEQIVWPVVYRSSKLGVAKWSHNKTIKKAPLGK